MRSRWRILLLVVSLGCEATDALQPFEGPGLRVLYVGNSLTYTNDLPGMVAALAGQDSQVVSYHMVAKPDFALVDHWSGGSDAVEQIRRGGWDVVVMQQGPSSLLESRADLIESARAFDREIRGVGARSAFYMVWPSSDRRAFFEDVRRSYQAAADTVGGVFIPAGEAWTEAWKRDSTVVLYGLDGFHPSWSGTYLAALAIYGRLYDRDVRELPDSVIIGGSVIPLSPTRIQLYQEAAHAASSKYPPSLLR